MITVVLAAGAMRRAPPTEGADVAFLPPGHAIANATREIDELFGDSGEVSVVTILFRGEALTPVGLSQMTALIDNIASDPSVVDLLVPAGLIVAGLGVGMSLIVMLTPLLAGRTIIDWRRESRGTLPPAGGCRTHPGIV